MTLAPERTLRPLIQTPFDEYFPAVSPDGHWLAYVSNESGRRQVYVQPFPALDRKWQISTDGGRWPVWARDGRELFYEKDHTLMVVPMASAAMFERDRVLAHTRSYVSQVEEHYAGGKAHGGSRA